jgi:hypothetical protein
MIFKFQYFEIFGTIVWAMKKLSISLNRAHGVVLGTRMKRLEQTPGSVAGEMSRIDH